jgi:hypothetical protein
MAVLIRLSTSASEVPKVLVVEARYSKSFLELTKPTAESPEWHMSKRGYSAVAHPTHGGGKKYSQSKIALCKHECASSIRSDAGG